MRGAGKAGSWAVAALLALGFWQLGQGAYIPAKAWLAQELMQRAWLRVTAGEDRAAPWPWADTWPVARLKALGGDIDLVVLAGGSGRTLAFGPGHLSASAMPGQVGNAVIGADTMLTGADDGSSSGAVGEITMFSPGPAIYGGTDQIQRNILGERVLGLGREPGPDRNTPFSELPKNV